MRDPSLYSTVPYNGLHVMVVDAGTVVKDERSGEEVVVDNKTAARKGSVLYCTKAIFDALKEKVPQA